MRALALVAALAALLSGCAASAPEPVASDLEGTWVHGGTTLVLASDGTFTLSNAPRYTLFTDTEGWRDGDTSTRDGFGDWSLEPDAVRLDNVQGEKFHGEKLFLGLPDRLYFGLDMGSTNPRCFELVREGSEAEPRDPEDCWLSP